MSATNATKPKGRGAAGRNLAARELAAWRGFLRVHARVTRELDAELLAEHGLSLSSYEVLLFLAETQEGQMRMSELADSVLLSRSGLTRLVDRLERAGLVRREPCESDLRGWNALITEEGRRAFASARRTHLAGVRARWLAHFSEEELAALAGYWERVVPGAAGVGPAC